jgi:hypothetical protein
MCGQTRVPGSKFWRAQQVLCAPSPRTPSRAACCAVAGERAPAHRSRRGLSPFTRAPLLPPARARRLKLYGGTKAERLEPAVIIDGTGPSALSALYANILSSGEKRYVSEADVTPLPARAFVPGDMVRRALWSGEEEDAEVRAAAAFAAMLRCRLRAQHRCALVCGAARAPLPARGTSHTLAPC